jgi:hypothetical protein
LELPGDGTLNPLVGPGVGGKMPYCGVPGTLPIPPPTLSGRGLPTPLGVRGASERALIGGAPAPAPAGPNELGGKPSPTALGGAEPAVYGLCGWPGVYGLCGGPGDAVYGEDGVKDAETGVPYGEPP